MNNKAELLPTTTRAHRTGGSRLLAACIAATLCAPALAQETVATGDDTARILDALNPYLTVGYGYDSNLFRLDEAVFDSDEDVSISGKNAMSDSYAMVSAGLDTEIKRSLQRFNLYGEVSHTLFNEYDDIDYTGSKAGASGSIVPCAKLRAVSRKAS